MCCTCDMVLHMSKMIQIRNVPDEVHREVKARAARAGMSLSDFLRRAVEQLVQAPTIDEIERRLACLPDVEPGVDVVAEIRAMREERTDQLLARAEGVSAGGSAPGDDLS